MAGDVLALALTVQHGRGTRRPTPKRYSTSGYPNYRINFAWDGHRHRPAKALLSKESLRESSFAPLNKIQVSVLIRLTRMTYVCGGRGGVWNAGIG
jgi:hypothetical protein